MEEEWLPTDVALKGEVEVEAEEKEVEAGMARGLEGRVW